MTSTFLHPHQIIPLDFDTTIPAVPESHEWPESGDHPSSDFPSILPTIDLEDPNAVKHLADACGTWGVFQITGHRVPLQLLEDVERETRRLFSLPMKRKMKALRSGATGYGLPKISPFFAKSMWCEGFTIMGSPVEDAKKLWPYDYGRFCDVMGEYEKEMKLVAEKHILPLILQSLGVSREEMESLCHLDGEEDIDCNLRRRPSTALQLNSYPSCPEPSRAMGLAPHTDTSLFTLIHQCGGDGLQIFRGGDGGPGWVTVGPVARGSLVVNLGDFFHVLSNARFPAVLHRAVVNEARHRLSVAYFYGLPMNAHVQAFPKLVPQGELPGRYRPVTAREYIELKNKHLYRALSLIRT